jgi:hypothetical protein
MNKIENSILLIIFIDIISKMKWNQNNIRSFTEDNIKNRELILNMLKYEDETIHGEIGKSIYDNESYEHFSSLETTYMFHRITLNAFGFKTTDEDLQNYRKIFSYYYKSPTEYDKEILESVTYMRENKCVYYTGKTYNVGDVYDNVEVYDITGKNKINVIDKINPVDKYTIVGAFSNS